VQQSAKSHVDGKTIAIQTLQQNIRMFVQVENQRRQDRQQEQIYADHLD
jgi:hypothetical protein